MYAIKFDSAVDKVIAKWKKSNPIMFKKLKKVLKSIANDPRKGIGKPEAMIGGRDMVYSRHITAHDRIIYKIHDMEVYVIVVDIEGHYDDK